MKCAPVRVCHARHQLLDRRIARPRDNSAPRVREQFALVRHCTWVDGPFAPIPYDVVECLYSMPKGPLKLAMMLLEKASRCLSWAITKGVRFRDAICRKSLSCNIFN
jgi:hypothetical protein